MKKNHGDSFRPFFNSMGLFPEIVGNIVCPEFDWAAA